jgi:uncharacterized membrane protein
MTTADRWLFGLKLFSVLGCGLIAGAFLAFSSFVMSALGRLPGPQGMAAMQSINITVINPVFMGVLMGTVLSCLAAGVLALLRWNQPGSALLVAGCLLYLVGTFGVTIVFNVPLNDALAVAKPESAEGARLWASYLTNWTIWNHVRTLASLAASACFILSLRSPTP